MLKSAVLSAILLLGSTVYAGPSTELAAALQAYREAPAPSEELSLAVFLASLKSLSHEEYTVAIMEGHAEIYGDAHPIPPKRWRNGELSLILMEHIMAGNEAQKWMGWHLLRDVQRSISRFAGEHASQRGVVERLFRLAAELPAQLPGDRWIDNWSVNRRDLVVRAINGFGGREDPLQSLAVVKNVEEFLNVLPEGFLKGDVLRALGQSRREGALPYLMSVARHAENPKQRLGALLGLAHFAERPELLELAREIAANKRSGDADARNLVSTAVGMINNHYVQAQRLRRPVDSRALEIANELWRLPHRSDLQRWLLYYMGPINEKFVEDIFIEALLQPDVELQNTAIELSTGGQRIVESPLIENAITEISKHTSSVQQKELAQKYLKRRRDIRKAGGGCENLITNRDSKNQT